MAVGENETCEKSKHLEEKITNTTRESRQTRQEKHLHMNNKYPQQRTGNTRLDEAVMKKNQLGIKGVNNEEMMNSVGRLKGRRTNE